MSLLIYLDAYAAGVRHAASALNDDSEQTRVLLGRRTSHEIDAPASVGRWPRAEPELGRLSRRRDRWFVKGRSYVKGLALFGRF
jgi:hypothetical protein